VSGGKEVIRSTLYGGAEVPSYEVHSSTPPRAFWISVVNLLGLACSMIGVVMLFYRRRKQEATNMEEPEQHQENLTVIRAVTSGDRVVAEHQADRGQTAALETGRRYREYGTIGALLLAAGAALLTLIVTHCDTRDLITETQTAAKQQHNDTITSNQISREAYTSVQRAFVFVKELQFTTRTGTDPLNPGNYPELWWFSPIIENSGNTPTKSLQVLFIASCAYDPLRILFGMGPQQTLSCEDIPPAGPRDPEDLFLNRAQLNSKIISTALGPRSTFPSEASAFLLSTLKKR
jgi:hypothetical protein